MVVSYSNAIPVQYMPPTKQADAKMVEEAQVRTWHKWYPNKHVHVHM